MNYIIYYLCSDRKHFHYSIDIEWKLGRYLKVCAKMED